MIALPKEQLEAVIQKFGGHKGALHKAAAHHLRKSGKRSRAKLTFCSGPAVRASKALNTCVGSSGAFA